MLKFTSFSMTILVATQQAIGGQISSWETYASTSADMQIAGTDTFGDNPLPVNHFLAPSETDALREKDFLNGTMSVRSNARALKGLLLAGFGYDVSLQANRTGRDRFTRPVGARMTGQSAARFTSYDLLISGPDPVVLGSVNFTASYIPSDSGLQPETFGLEPSRWNLRVRRGNGQEIINRFVTVAEAANNGTITTGTVFLPVGETISATLELVLNVRAFPHQGDIPNGQTWSASNGAAATMFFGGFANSGARGTVRTPVMNLPDGFTLNSPDSDIVDNFYVGPVPSPGAGFACAMSLVFTSRRRRSII